MMNKKEILNEWSVNSYTEWYRANYHSGIGINAFLDDNNRPDENYIPMMRGFYLRVERFLIAQNKWGAFEKAIEEVKAGKVKTHWTWFVFPCRNNHSDDDMARYYQLSWDEELEYFSHPVLRARLIRITEAVYNHEKTVYEIFGDEAIQVRSCMLIFATVSDNPVFKKMIQKYGWK